MLNARKAKRFLDGRSFYGSILHVCYAPELESTEETRLKLINRRNEIAYYTGRRLKVPKLDTLVASKRKAFNTRDPRGSKMLKSVPQKIETFNNGIPSEPNFRENPPSTAQRLPEVSDPNNSIPGASGGTFVIGPYDEAPSYPSQEILRLPGQEVKVERDRKFMPASVLRRNPSTKVSTNKIIFHHKNAS
uniref:RNA-binding protein 48 n=1 Tax=Lygus hesperus TaxID=30085 RepID=A0A146L296_LYGHE